MSTGHLTIDLGAIVANWRALDAMSAGHVETGATVKANAYSLGAAPVSRALAKAGCRTFFVAAAEEGAAVRQSVGDKPRVFVYSGHMAGDTDMIGDLGLIPLLNSIEQMTRHIEALPGHPFGIQLDSGMNRLGMEPEEWFAVRDLVLKQGPKLIISHLACGDEPAHPMNAQQLDQFRAMTDGLQVPLSLSATAGVLLGPEYHFAMTRPGIGLYGGLPFAEASPVAAVSIPVIQTRDLEEGEPVGYGNAWIAERPTRIATIAAGYADGIIRAASNNGTLFAGCKPCKLVGRVSMDMLTIDITDLDRTPSALEILGPDQGIDALAEQAGTIGHEILTALGNRYQRRYRGAP
ncbi:Alanine racemase [Candidatus Rhodobacter oscarellae]|uniref:Alanine racemase n=1 Tax=Candidatus Rhodobacter oscarellae TaxID=1675527 RepID=A0A0J9E2U0_9RHOB|nr:alanine racemase [Candidatus Rhodobacter lobularis]KMW57027.1 Alanine racemase [Candidatus Rhodobacter lobularis]